MFCRLQKVLYLCSVNKNKQTLKHMKYYINDKRVSRGTFKKYLDLHKCVSIYENKNNERFIYLCDCELSKILANR